MNWFAFSGSEMHLFDFSFLGCSALDNLQLNGWIGSVGKHCVQYVRGGDGNYSPIQPPTIDEDVAALKEHVLVGGGGGG